MKNINFLRAGVIVLILALNMNHVHAADSKSYQTFLNEYKDLFLTNTNRLHLEGRHEEAKQEKMKDWRSRNCACNIPTEESLVVKDRQNNLIQMICKNIEEVKKSYEEQKDAPRKYQEKIELVINQQIKFEKDSEAAWRADDELLTKKRSELISVRDYIGDCVEDIGKVSLDGEQNVYMLVDNYLWKFEKINKENQQKYIEIAEKIYDIWQENVINLFQKIKNNRTEFEGKINDYKIFIEKYKAHLQKEYLAISQQKMTMEYPYEKIERLEKQIEFVKKNASFLSPQPRPKEVTHGLSGLSGTRGGGVVIDILDYFPTNLSSTPNDLLSKVTNPNFNGSENPDQENALHGICVASISASREVGIAQDAQLEYLDIKMMDIVNSEPTQFLFGSAICQNQTRLGVHVSFLDSLPKFERGKTYPIEQADIEPLENVEEVNKLKNIGMSPILQSQAKVINMSMGNSTFGADSNVNNPDAYLETFIHFKAFADLGILSVTTLGNNGLYLTGSNGLFVKRAFAKAKTTREKIIFVGGLLEDGLTILSMSNQPGEDIDLQERTIFTQGANVPCLFINKNTYGQETGTSFASPSVSGAAAIIMSQCQSITAEGVSECILKGATPILLNEEGLPYELNDCDAGTVLTIHPELEAVIKRSRAKYGMGRLNVGRALERGKKMVKSKSE